MSSFTVRTTKTQWKMEEREDVGSTISGGFLSSRITTNLIFFDQYLTINLFPIFSLCVEKSRENELGLIKVPNSHGGFLYHLPKQDDRPHLQRLRRILQQAFLSQSAQRGMVMIKVQPGNGQLVANLFEQVQFPEIFGTLSDDGSVLVLLKDGVPSIQVTSMVQKLLEK
jgi:transcriptional regulator of arginine metabolism